MTIVNIEEAMEKIAAVEETLRVEIDGLGEFGVTKAWPDNPSGLNGNLPTPCFLNYSQLDSSSASNGARTQMYTIRTHLYLAEKGSDLEKWGRIARAFNQAFLDAFARNVMLGDVNVICLVKSNEGAAEIPASLSWNSTEPTHYGLEFLLSLMHCDSYEMGA